jgi:hypothetical protein
VDDGAVPRGARCFGGSGLGFRIVGGVLGRCLAAVRARPGAAALLALALAWALTIHTMGWAQSAHYAQVRALADGQAEIDPWHWETKDKAWIDGHFYSVKPPGLALLSLPPHLALDALGADRVAERAAGQAREADQPRWVSNQQPPYLQHGFDGDRAAEVGGRIERYTPLVWVLTLLVAVLPATALLFAVRWVADRIEPGYGTAAAITLGLGTILMTFAAEYFSHVLAAALPFAAFALLFRERQGPPRTVIAALAGLLCGLAVTLEYPAGLAGIVLFAYAISSGPRLARGSAYAAAAFVGALPALAFNTWAFGSPLEFAYGSAVAVQGLDGHAVLGLNDDGFFGIGLPRLDAVVELLISSRGILTLTPVLALTALGTVLVHRRGFRAEAWVIAAIAAAYFVYNAGYWLPMGGGSPGPRFLIPALPFLAVTFAACWRRLPTLTLALAVPSALIMLAGAVTFPLIGENGIATWVERIEAASFEHTALTILGVSSGWIAVAPVLLLALLAAALAARATPITAVDDLAAALVAICFWVGVALVGPSISGDATTPLGAGGKAIWLVGVGAALAFAAVGALAVARRRAVLAQSAPASEPEPAPSSVS